jgi:hypothetical protein
MKNIILSTLIALFFLSFFFSKKPSARVSIDYSEIEIEFVADGQ